MGEWQARRAVFYAGRVKKIKMFELSKKIKALPPYLFVEIDKAKRKARQAGRDIIDLGIGDPDLPTPDYIIDALHKAAQDPANHRYALDQGMPVLRRAIARWYKDRFGVELNPDTEILPMIGSKEGIAHFPLAFLDTGDYSLIPDPCYPPYKGGTIFAGGKCHLMPLLEANAFLPDFKKIPVAIRKKSRMLYINYPNNPTSAVVEPGFYRDAVEFCRKNKFILVSDLAYSEMYYDGQAPHSALETEGARDMTIEFHSLSKTFNMTGWRVGWACGNSGLISALAKVKSNIDSGIFSGIQLAGAAALEGPKDHVQNMRAIYQERRDVLIAGLKSLGWQVEPPKATFYVWIRNPRKMTSIEASGLLLEKADIVATPGVGFGKYGEGYIRMALTVPAERIKVAIERIRKI